MKKILAVIGPTASGKTNLALKIAKKFSGELINADSRQIYKELNIGTAKGNLEKLSAVSCQLSAKYSLDTIPIHLVNIISPDKTLTLAQYQKLAYEAIENIIKRKKLPILVGGTGLYIDAVTKGYSIPKVKPNHNLRQELNHLTTRELQKKLQEIDKAIFDKLNESDKSNPRRLIRLIEISENQISNIRNQKQKLKTKNKYNTVFIKPLYDRKKLYEKINKRVLEMLDQGFLDEVEVLLKKGYKFDTPSFSAIAYPIAKKFLKGEVTKEQFISIWQQKERNYARRQETWFRRYQCLKYLNINNLYLKIQRFLK